MSVGGSGNRQNNGMGSNNRPTRRQPNNLQSLLQFAIEANKNEDTPSSSNTQPMDEDRRRFLEEAIGSLSVNITNDMQDSINILSNKEKISAIVVGSEVPKEVENAFDTIENHITCIDTAIGFFKLGGFSVFPVCLSCEHSSVRRAACNLLAELCQSNPFCQTRVLECGYLQTLIDMLNNEKDVQVLIKVLYAVSCIIRHHEPCTETFLEKNNSYLGLKNALETSSVQLKAKAAFLINCLYPDHKFMIDKLKSSGLLKALVWALPEKRDNYTEQIIAALYTITTDRDNNVIMEVSKPEYNFKEILLKYVQTNNLVPGNFDYDDEEFYCATMLNKLSECNTSQKINKEVEADVDR